jgi:hypothetical protein
MKIIIIHTYLLPDDKHFNELTDEEVLQLCNDPMLYDEYESIGELAANWNSDEILYPTSSYIRVIDDQPDVEALAETFNGLTASKKDEFLRLTGNE